MKLLLDECLPRRLKLDFQQHQTLTVEDAGLKGLKNGPLLRAAAKQFEVLVTVDLNIVFQQNLADIDLALIILRANRNSYAALRSLVPETLDVLKTIKPGDIVIVPAERQDPLNDN